MPTESTPHRSPNETVHTLVLAALLAAGSFAPRSAPAGELPHPRLLSGPAGIDSAKEWIAKYPWYRSIFEEHRAEI
ncbi:MAG TPA: hypothetical protein VMF59_14055, partial [Bacteroidota bacterium]|nr:hypothetical protein [Bacteroidota bacterium]